LSFELYFDLADNALGFAALQETLHPIPTRIIFWKGDKKVYVQVSKQNPLGVGLNKRG
jgi:hypothetical protein